MPHLLTKMAIAAVAVTLAASFTQAEAMPRLVQSGYASLPVEQVRSYRRYKKRYPQTYTYESEYPRTYNRRGYDYYPPGYSDEIHELRRAFPSTNWPPSMRY